MSTPEQEVQEGRQKRTVLLMAGGAFSLILPLLGVVYIRMNESKAARAPNASVTFEHREGGDAKLSPTQTVTINPAVAVPAASQSSLPVAGQPGMTPAPGSGSSLDFVKGGNSYYQDNKAAEAPKASSAPAAAAPAPAPEPAPVAKAADKKGAKKPFVMPKLQGTKSFSNFKSGSSSKSSGKGLSNAGDPQSGKGGGSMADMLKNVPGGVDNPDVQKLLKSQGK